MSLPWRAVSFDCFGTLIDWKRGQRRVLEQLPSLLSHHARLDEVLQAREAEEQRIQRGPWRSYEEILASSLTEACRSTLGVELSARESSAFAAGQLGWPAFEDTVAGLTQIATTLPIALLSNCDQELLELCARKHLAGLPSLLISAEQVQSYKPAPAHWNALTETTGLAPAEVLHVSFARDYDLDRAHEMGFSLGFVGRYQIPAPSDLPLQVQAPDLKSFADALVSA